MGTRRNLVPIFICDATTLRSLAPFSDVSSAFRSVPDLTLVTGKLGQDGCRLIERDLRISGNIEDAARNRLSRRVGTILNGISNRIDAHFAQIPVTPEDESISETRPLPITE